MNRILLVEDQKEFHLLVQKALVGEANQITIASTISESRTILAKEKFDLILLDINLPDRDGLEYFAEVRASGAPTERTPVIFLTSAEGLPSKLAAFSLGADDYVTKPFDAQELRARVEGKIRNAKRRQARVEEPQIGPFKFKLAAQTVSHVQDGVEISLTPREFRLLYVLAKNEGRALSRDELLHEVWGQETHVGDRTVDSNMYLLRKKLQGAGEWIESVPGVGYRFRQRATKNSAA